MAVGGGAIRRCTGKNLHRWCILGEADALALRRVRSGWRAGCRARCLGTRAVAPLSCALPLLLHTDTLRFYPCEARIDLASLQCSHERVHRLESGRLSGCCGEIDVTPSRSAISGDMSAIAGRFGLQSFDQVHPSIAHPRVDHQRLEMLLVLRRSGVVARCSCCVSVAVGWRRCCMGDTRDV